MRASLVGVLFMMATNTVVAQNIERASVVYVETPLAKQLIYRWKSCLSRSFHLHRKLTAEDTAADIALRACASEEKKYHDYWSVRLVSDATFAREKSVVKKYLLEGRYDHLRRPS
jgi:hypothetical protein